MAVGDFRQEAEAGKVVVVVLLLVAELNVDFIFEAGDNGALVVVLVVLLQVELEVLLFVLGLLLLQFTKVASVCEELNLTLRLVLCCC